MTPSKGRAMDNQRNSKGKGRKRKEKKETQSSLVHTHTHTHTHTHLDHQYGYDTLHPSPRTSGSRCVSARGQAGRPGVDGAFRCAGYVWRRRKCGRQPGGHAARRPPGHGRRLRPCGSHCRAPSAARRPPPAPWPLGSGLRCTTTAR